LRCYARFTVRLTLAVQEFFVCFVRQARIQLVDDATLQQTALVDDKFWYFAKVQYPCDRITLVCTREESAEGEAEFSMLAAKAYAAGDVIFANEGLYVPEDVALVIRICGQRVWLDQLVHTINRGSGMREFYAWDSFQNHSCEPNTEMRYETGWQKHECIRGARGARYELVATRDIAQDEELTSDYETFDSQADGTEFECKCGSINCRKIIRG